MIDFSEIGLFTTKDGKKVTYEDLLRDVYENSDESRKAMRALMEQLTSLIDSPQAAMELMEHITNLLDARVKNDDILVKIASILSRIIQKGMVTEDNKEDWEITEEEKKQLLLEAENMMDATSGSQDVIE